MDSSLIPYIIMKMKKTGNKFIIFIIISIIWIIIISLYSSYFSSTPRDSFVVLLNGKAMLNSKILEWDKRNKLQQWDTIKTIGEKSLAVVEWGDGSVTRLWWNSRLVVEELFVSDDVWKINISFDLLSGKTWSNVISFIGEESYFKQTFRDNEAAVRGTIFNVDLVQEYLYVLDHKVLLTNGSWSIFEITEEKPFSLDSFSFIKLEEFIQNIKDKSFDEFNKLFDEELKAELKVKLEESISKFKDLSSVEIASLTDEKKQELYDEIMARYQKLNFIDSQTKDLFDKKIEYKTFLINIASDIQKDVLIESTLADLKDTIDSKDYSSLESILGILNENAEKIKGLDINSYFDKTVIWDDLKNAIDKNFEILENIFGSDISILVSEGKLQLSDIEAIKNAAKQKIEDGLNILLDK